MTHWNKIFLILIFICGQFSSHAQEKEIVHNLDPAYNDLVPPIVDISESDKSELKRSNFEDMVEFMSPVRSQGSRGTCSIFSAVAMLEALAIRDLDEKDIDLSEEWVEYLAISERNSTSDGSWAYFNWHVVEKHGILNETQMPYIGETWNNANFGKARRRCGHLSTYQKKVCLIAHDNPAYIMVNLDDLLNPNSTIYSKDWYDRRQAAKMQYSELFAKILKPMNSRWGGPYRVDKVSTAKDMLDRGNPIILSLDFYYGAWNHSKATSFGIKRNMDHYHQGIVGSPVYGSKDYTESQKNRSGHSILVIGYDDEKIVEVDVQMDNGQTLRKQFKGVYYFKNSWGTTGFGKDFVVDGKSYPGYGMITYDYAHNHGSLYYLPNNKF